jgi:hypothetical protein
VNLIDVVDKLESLDDIQRSNYRKMARHFDQYMPASLYMDFYELAKGGKVDDETYVPSLDGFSSEMWEDFLDVPEVFQWRQAKIGKLLEFGATKALRALQKKGLEPGNTAQVQALRDIIDRAKTLQAGQNRRRRVVLSFVSPKIYDKQMSDQPK